MQTSEILNKAADLIEKRGWTQWNSGWGEGDHPLCLEGAIEASAGIYRKVDPVAWYQANPARDAVIDYLGHEHPYQWNDQGGRTANEVIGVLRAAGLIELAKENSVVAHGNPCTGRDHDAARHRATLQHQHHASRRDYQKGVME